MQRSKFSKSSQVNEKVDSVVQEYMDTLLSDLFPETPPLEPVESDLSVSELPEKPTVERLQKENVTNKGFEEGKINTSTESADEKSLEKDNESNLLTTENVPIDEPAVIEPEVTQKEKTVVNASVQTEISNRDSSPVVNPPLPSDEILSEVPIEVVETEATASKPENIEKLFPNAPDWAQQSFDVLLFDVCGLKLAVPMDTLGKIIKAEKDLNALIGRPGWFMGAYTESEDSLYVVDTAKYIMPEKGFDLTRDGFSYLIQMQRSKWTLACQNVHTTVRLEPDQVKWRSQDGKRKWLAGTVIEHMCALVHVDSLVEILEAEAS